MAIKEQDIIDVTPGRLTGAEALYVPAILKGLGTTLRHFFQNVGRDGKAKKNIWVVQYPEEKRDDRTVEGGRRAAPRQLPGRAPAQPRRGRPRTLRGVLHVRDRLPGELHSHRGRGVALARPREVPQAVRYR
jgi:hypothetical protein